MRPVLEVRRLSKAYGPTQVLRDVSFSVRAGEAVALTGRSGSGKSTLFRLLAGLDHPSAGQVLLDGEDVSQLDDARASQLRLRRIGLVFQSFNLIPDLTAFENIRLPLDLAGVRRADAEARAQELAALVGVDRVARQLPARLSGGEAQRTAIARALANRPTILLADEPTGSLDRRNAEQVLDVFREVNRALGATILVITHDPLAMERFARRLHIEEGIVSETAAPA